MPYYIYVWISYSVEHALRLFFWWQIENAMNRDHHEVELLQYLVTVVQRAIAQDVALAAFENVEALAKLFVQLINLVPLSSQGVLSEATGIGSCFAVIGQAKIRVATSHAGFGHLANRIFPVTPGRMGM